MAVKDKELIINGKAIRSPEQQVFKNMEDIAELQEVIKPEYKCTTELSTSATSVAKSYTNAGEDVDSGWLLDPVGKKFKITGGDEDNLLIVFYTSCQGPQGEDGTDGVTPNISASATVDSQTGTPSVVVTKTGTDEAPTFTFAFHNLKGETGTSLISVEVVASLPTSGNAGTLYFVQSSDPHSQNVYDEYIWLSSGWEKLGSQTIDLSNYIQKSFTSGLVKNDGTIDTTQYQPLLSTPTTLWTNPNPNSSFATQTIQLSEAIESGDLLAIEWRQSNESPQHYITYLRYISANADKDSAFMNTDAYYGGTMYSISRLVSFTDSTHIKFGNAYSNTSQTNEACIPYKIYKTNREI